MRKLVLVGAVLTLTVLGLPGAVRAAGSDDIPGAQMNIGQAVSGTIDSTTRPDTVYSVDLHYGDEIVVSAQELNGHGFHVRLLTPDSASILNGRYKELANTHSGSGTPGQIVYMPAVDGTYYLWLHAESVGANYQVSVATTGTQVSGPQVADIFGAPIGLGSVSGVIDSTTRPDTVFATRLFASEQVVISALELSGHGFHVRLLTPDSASILNGRYKELANTHSGSGKPGQIVYMPAVDGTYYLWLHAESVGAPYTLTLTGSAEVPAYPCLLQLRASATAAKRGKPVTLSATLVDQASKPVGGKSISLQSSLDGRNWVSIRSLASSSGSYSTSVIVKRSTWFRMAFDGSSDYASCVSRKLLIKAL